jgi:nucleotide-binding universal stress UspA family protein
LVDEVFARARSTLADWTDQVETIKAQGDPRCEILTAAESQTADLIVVGARGLGAVKRLLLGSVSHSVAHAAKVPVLVVRTNPARSAADPLRILLACESAETGRKLAEFVGNFNWPATAIGQVMSVYLTFPNWSVNTPRSKEVEDLIAVWVRQQKDEMRAEGQQLEELNRVLPRAFHQSPPKYVEGSAEQKILETANEQHSDLIVVGTRTSTFLGRLFLGSTSNAVLAHAPCSVLLVRNTG